MRYLLANRFFTITHPAIRQWAERAGVQLYWTDVKEPPLENTRLYSLQPFVEGVDPFENQLWDPKSDIPRSCEHLLIIAWRIPRAICDGAFRIVEVPDGVDVLVHEDDSGWEWLAERHRTWE